jgi:hypothetical protein
LGAQPSDQQAAFALACAEHLVRVEASARQGELLEILATGWLTLAGRGKDLSALRASLETREDLDDDEVAAVALALDAVSGCSTAAWQAVSRATDAAYERVPYPPGLSEFRPLATDTAEPVVQQELRWQTRAMATLERSENLQEAIRNLLTLL